MSDKKTKYKEVAYYPGCALEGSGHAYNRSTKALGKKLGLKLKEVDNWNCCGAMDATMLLPLPQSTALRPVNGSTTVTLLSVTSPLLVTVSV